MHEPRSFYGDGEMMIVADGISQFAEFFKPQQLTAYEGGWGLDVSQRGREEGGGVVSQSGRGGGLLLVPPSLLLFPLNLKSSHEKKKKKELLFGK